jgi:hypothetical protein
MTTTKEKLRHTTMTEREKGDGTRRKRRDEKVEETRTTRAWDA